MPFPTSGNLFYLLKIVQLWFRSLPFSLEMVFLSTLLEEASSLAPSARGMNIKLLLEAVSASHPPDKNLHNRAVFGFLPSAVLHIFVWTL